MKKEERMAQIKSIYEESCEIYGTSKIAAKMRQGGNKVSTRTMGKYMKQIGSQVCYRKHKTCTPRGCDFDSQPL